MQDTRKLTVLGRFNYGSIPMITQFVADAAQAAMLDEDAVFHCQMAVDEACTNVIEHAYGENPDAHFEVSCSIEPGKVIIQIVDQGKQFDPTKVPPPKIGSNLDEIRPGGVGIHLIRQLMDEVKFDYTDRGNVLTLTKTSLPIVKALSSTGIPVRRGKKDIWVVEPHGQLDSSVASDLDRTITETIKQGHIRVVVQLAEVSYISSKGLKALVSGWRLARAAGGDLVLCAVVPRVQSIIDTIGLSQIFSVYLTLDEALEALSSASR